MSDNGLSFRCSDDCVSGPWGPTILRHAGRRWRLSRLSTSDPYRGTFLRRTLAWAAGEVLPPRALELPVRPGAERGRAATTPTALPIPLLPLSGMYSGWRPPQKEKLPPAPPSSTSLRDCGAATTVQAVVTPHSVEGVKIDTDKAVAESRVLSMVADAPRCRRRVGDGRGDGGGESGGGAVRDTGKIS